MKAIVQERFGAPDVLRVVDTDLPRIGPTTCSSGSGPRRSTPGAAGSQSPQTPDRGREPAPDGGPRAPRSAPPWH